MDNGWAARIALLATLVGLLAGCGGGGGGGGSVTIAFTAPQPQARMVTRGDLVILTVSATAPNGISRVEFTVGGTSLETEAPYQASWNTTGVAEGNHTVVATAYDRSNPARSATTQIQISVQAGGVTVAFTAPTTGASFYQGEIVSLEVTAASVGANVTKVEFYADNALLGDDTSAPFTYQWDTTAVAPGTRYLTAKAYDDSVPQRVGAVTMAVTILEASTAPPTVQILSPASNETVSWSLDVDVAAQAQAPGATIQNVVVTLGSLERTVAGGTAEVTGTVTFDTTQLNDGQYTLTATARDSGNRTQTATIIVNVANGVSPPPPPF